MQAQAAEFFGYAGKIPLLFGEKSFETVCFDSSFFKLIFRQERKSGMGGSLHVNGGRRPSFTELFNINNVNNN
jgi:hypothetical protein